MATEEFKVNLTADDKISPSIKKVLAAFDDLEQQAKDTATAADALGRALGPELAAKADTTAIVSDLQNMGLSLDEITANADQLGGKMRELSDVDVGGKLGGSLGTARGKTDELGDAAVKGRNSLANMFGNVAQDASGLAGNLGSLGVGIGQLAEGAADAALGGEQLTSALASTVAMAGPIAALAAGFQLLNEVMGARAKSAAAEAKATEQLTNAYKKGGDAASNYADELRSAGEITATFGENTLAQTGKLGTAVAMMGTAGDAISDLGQHFGVFGKSVEDLSPMFSRAGISVDTWAKAVVGGNQGYGDLSQALKGTSLDAVDQRKILDALSESQTKNTEAKNNAASVEAVFGDKTAETTDKLNSQSRELDRAKDATDNLISSVDAEIDKQRDAADALRDHADALNEQIDAATDAADQSLAVADAQAKYNDALKDSKVSHEDTRDAAIDLAKAQVSLAEKTAAAAGTTLTATQKVDNFNGALVDAAQQAKGPTRQAILDYIGSVNQIPPEKVTEIQAAIDAGDLATAKRLLDEASKTRSSAIVADAETSQAANELDNLERARYVKIYAQYQPTKVPANYGAGAATPRSVPKGAPAGPSAMSVDVPAPAVAGMSTTAAVTVPVQLALPSAADVARRIGPIRIPLFVQAGLRADRRINGNL